ncbi:MAG: 23S rRNA (guanosine-2'-O-)-methyltransferase RlmB [Gammaproteobacteria bacterium]|nr:23S rRNA (guanosine-2'-O-)-methyltransferase RlmB [Gammaproteobacteria bacterium]
MNESRVYGCHVVGAILDHAPERILTVYFNRGRFDERLNALRVRVASLGLASEECRKDTLDRFVGPITHQGVVARVRPATTLDERALYQWTETAAQPLLLILDGIQDPGNLGACIRNADAAGAEMVVIGRSQSADLTAAARKAASGAAEWLPVARIGNLARVMAGLKEQGVWLLGADAHGECPYYQADLKGAVGLVLGAEGTGSRHLTRESCDATVYIPMLGGVGSLNVSVASGVLLYEAQRQRCEDG